MSLVLPMRTSLRWRGPHAIFRSIRVQVIRLSRVHGTEMCCIDHCLLHLVQGCLVDSCPLPLEICLKHRSQRGCDSLEPFDKLLVTSTSPDKLSNFMNRGGRRPTSNDLDLFRVHVYSIFIDNVSAKVYWTLEECGFIDAGKQLASM